MAWGPRLAFAALKSWEDITDKFLFKVGGDGGGEGRVAIQYAFDVYGMRDWLENRDQEMKVFSFTGVEMDLWLAENPSENPSASWV